MNVSDPSLTADEISAEVARLEEESIKIGFDFPMCPTCQYNEFQRLQKQIEQIQSETQMIEKRSTELDCQLKAVHQDEEIKRLKEEEIALNEELSQIDKEIEEAQKLKEEFAETEEILDYIESRSWELRNEYLMEMESASEEIQQLEAKIHRTQKHIELLKSANPLCDAFVIRCEENSINGLKLSSQLDARETNAALGMCCLLIHLLQKKFQIDGIRIIPLGSFSWVQYDAPSSTTTAAASSSSSHQSSSLASASQSITNSGSSSVPSSSSSSSSSPSASAPSSSGLAPGATKNPGGSGKKKQIRPLFFSTTPKDHMQLFEEGLAALARAMDELTQYLSNRGYQKPSSKLTMSEFQDKEEVKKPLKWKFIDGWGRDFLLWLDHLAHFASHTPAAP
eukprot:MONOS_13014.1-p1 / transcript=MONOS_13014.1 / gene=MONOS_13014 / organism=Monocercomonoides_exilis_PA203 / gene_product=Vacuolar protein sorting 30/Beclin / transcript_product=Vacuolar protein sorting 30/Beclin / location=Mono_scaffold00766:18118-19993(+) / protein_length=395 / sequence_SO=supercontig / SO=protein_coding / is_pseudo=false